MKKNGLMIFSALICGVVFIGCSNIDEEAPIVCPSGGYITNESDATLKNTESYYRTFVLGDEEGAIIKVQAAHAEKSELIRDASTNMSVVYHYKPVSDFIGQDEVVIEVHYNKTGVNPVVETVKINFTVTADENEETMSIVGLWRLEVVSWWDGEPLHLDYSPNNIIYDFRNNNILSVSGETDGIEDYRGHTEGDHTYKIFPLPPSGPAGPCPVPQIEIDAETYTVSFGWVFFDSYEGPAMHIGTQQGTLILVNVNNLSDCERCNNQSN
jgi:hypothetical protein